MRNAGGALPSRHVLGNYELFEEIGRGGMGIVYRALDLSLDRIVAIKILRDDLRAHQSIVTRFSREAQAAARLDHPNIVQIYSVGAVDRTPYIAMEFVDALPLSAVMQREHRLEWKAALTIARQIAEALACAHDSHVIHRDVKPPNILLDDHHRAYVTDFGIAKILTLDDNLTVDGTRLGTPHYMAPERCKNGEVTAASDIYSLGVMMFQMLTGRLPYEASSPVEMVQRIISEPPARVRQYVEEVPEDIERLVAWLMELNPRHRPKDGHTVCNAIDRVQAGQPLDANEPRTIVAIDEFRKHLAADTASNKTTVSDVTRVSRMRRAIAAAVSIIALTVFGVTAWRAAQPAAPASNAGNPAAWFSASELATFGDEGENVTMSELQLPGYALLSLSPAGADGSVAALVEQHGASGKRVLCVVSPNTKTASVRFVSTPSARFEMLATVGAMSGSIFDGHGLVGTAGGVSLVSLREPSQPIVVSNTAESVSVAGMHPSGAQWAAPVIDSAGSASLSVAALANGRIEASQIVPPGPRIVHIQYSRDGQQIAYVRETGAGLFALYVVPVGGAVTEPVPIRTGRISLAPGAFNADASAILICVERDDGSPAVEVVSTGDAGSTAEFARALRGAWEPRSGDVVMSAPDSKGEVQLYRASLDATDHRTQLTFLDGGTDRALLVSPDGQSATTFAAATPKPSVLFASLAQ
ncbi:MAG: protein kinase [Candidatus Hydrogenedentes bacterium]|nr:protein kinase [Candidatus Hydrogenedentota bacterium]